MAQIVDEYQLDNENKMVDEDTNTLINSLDNSLDHYIISNIIMNNPQFITLPTYEMSIYKELILNDQYKNYDKEKYLNEIHKTLQFLNKERTYLSYNYDVIYDHVKNQVTYLQNIPQPAQHTSEWYKFRHEHITASNAWKAFGTQSSKNQLIYEKCKTHVEDNTQKISNLSETSLTWGHKYEPLTRMIYEHMNNTKINDFGCIEHPIHTFLAASPDGIVVGNNNFGRMIEIKNVVSREINGIPKLEYYIQTQLQMEVCNLDECDFVETKFKEYDNYNEYINDTTSNKKGIIIVYVNNGHYVYYYMPFDIIYETDINEWLDNNMHNEGEWIKNVYWCLEVYSCVLIKRDKNWFNYAVPILSDIWNTICVERVGDFSKRAPKKRISKTNINILG
jgi:putative phage-type endonuclease